MLADEQVCVIYAGVRGYLDDVLTTSIGDFEDKFLVFMKANHQKIMGEILKTGELSSENDKALGEILTEWLPSSGLEMRAK